MKVRHELSGEEKEVDAEGWKELVTDKEGHAFDVHHWQIVNVGPAEILPHHSDREINKQWQKKWDARQRSHRIETEKLFAAARAHEERAMHILHAIAGHDGLYRVTCEQAAKILDDALFVQSAAGGNFAVTVQTMVTLGGYRVKPGMEEDEEGEDSDGENDWEIGEWPD